MSHPLFEARPMSLPTNCTEGKKEAPEDNPGLFHHNLPNRLPVLSVHRHSGFQIDRGVFDLIVQGSHL